MTNQSELDEIIQHCNYMETTGEPGICHWCGERQTSDLHTLKKQILDWHNKQVEEVLNEMLVDVSSPSANIDQAEMIELINLYINKLKPIVQC